MPRVPRPDQTPAATSALPGVRVSTQAPVGAFGGGASAIDVGGLGRHVSNIVDFERRKADQVAVLDADNALAKIETDLLTATLQRKGKNAFAAPEEVEAEWTKRTAEVEKGLSNERQQTAYRERVANRWSSVYGNIQRHVAGEIQQYDNDTANSAIANRLDAAVRSNGEPHAVESAIEETQSIIADFGKRNGWSPDVLTEKKAVAVSRIHVGVIEQMLSLGNDQEAQAYFDDNKTAVASAQLPGVERALEQASTDGAGMRAADAVWKQLGPKGRNEPVRIATMEQALRDQQEGRAGAEAKTGIIDRIENGVAVIEVETDGALIFIERPASAFQGAREGATVTLSMGSDGSPALSPKVIKAAVAELRSRAAAFNAEQSETTAANKAALLGAVNEGATLASIKTRPEYRVLSGTEQESLANYIENRSEQDLTRKNFITFWSMSSPASLSKMTEQAILSSEPTLGRTLVGQLMQMKRSLGVKDAAADARVLAATIDEDLFKTIAADAGLKPYASKLDDSEKETLGRLKVSVENAIAREQERIDRPLTQSQKREVMQHIVDQHVMRSEWGRDPSVIAGTIKRDASGNLPSDIYVDIDRVPADYKANALNWLRSIGAIREGTDDAKALRQVGDRIGKAYAARIAGGTTAEIQAILRGQR